jgi:hypothetical protein
MPTPPTPAADEPLLHYFASAHLPPHLAAVSRPFGDLAHQVVAGLPRTPERTVCLRKLLEGKDAAVRCAVDAYHAAHTTAGGGTD